MPAITCKAIPIIGVLMGQWTCDLPQPAPTGKAPFCDVVIQAGGVKRPSRKDTEESAQYMNRLAAAHAVDCSAKR